MRTSLLPGLLLLGSLVPGIAAAQSPTTTAVPPVPAVPPASNATTGRATGSDSGLSTTTPAPVPNAVPEQVAPANRIDGAGPGGQANAAGPADATPFSSSPSGMLPSDARNGSHSREFAPSDSSEPPNLSK